MMAVSDAVDELASYVENGELDKVRTAFFVQSLIDQAKADAAAASRTREVYLTALIERETARANAAEASGGA